MTEDRYDQARRQALEDYMAADEADYPSLPSPLFVYLVVLLAIAAPALAYIIATLGGV